MMRKITRCGGAVLFGAAFASAAMAGGSATVNGPTAPVIPVVTTGAVGGSTGGGGGGGGATGGPVAPSFIQALVSSYTNR